LPVAPGISRILSLEQFQQKCAAVLRPELRQNKELKRFRDPEKCGNAPINAFLARFEQPAGG
ncbi:hypothetical protein AB4144_56780, partial [Rhizobiaceae sp. 2RAB30]